MIAVESSKNKIGMINVSAKINLVRKVAMVDSQTSLVECLFSASSDTWIPNASERASAIAITSIHPMIMICE